MNDVEAEQVPLLVILRVEDTSDHLDNLAPNLAARQLAQDVLKIERVYKSNILCFVNLLTLICFFSIFYLSTPYENFSWKS